MPIIALRRYRALYSPEWNDGSIRGVWGETLFRNSYFRDFSVAYALIFLIFDPLKFPGYQSSFDMHED